MRIHYIQNDPLATLGYIEEWVDKKNYSLSFTRMFENSILPSMDEFDMLVILGGRMGAYEEESFPWLVVEKNFIRKAIEHGKWVMGICLGVQLLANVLGSRVYPHTHQEIGWRPIEVTDEGMTSTLFNGIPPTFTAFQYHGDTFDLPQGAIRLAVSKGCANQSFSYGERIIGLQFHPEFTGDIILRLEEKFGNQISLGKYIQDPSKWGNQNVWLDGAKSVLFTVLDNMEAGVLKMESN
ncbi:type 1 glutamine amidotransferase [Neobacillus drentensis]|uniref:type 1 glutamine amidotransferase n=1 Tax=Neobacillus drentensis TaxID=220684 RepID=UPI002FFE8FA4